MRGEDEVAGAVEDALERLDLVGGQALGQGGDDRHAAGDAGLEGDGPAVPAGGVEDLGAVLGQQRLVGRHHVLARRQQRQHRLPRPVDAADQLDGDLDVGVAQHRLAGRWSAARGGRRTGRGLSGSRTTTRRSTSGRPARAARRSGCSSSSRATPPPTVPQPIRAMPSGSFMGIIVEPGNRFPYPTTSLPPRPHRHGKDTKSSCRVGVVAG